jgi:LCP family protein required for cell wall assembly
MSEWPDGWFRGGQGEDRQATDDANPGGTVSGGLRGVVPRGQSSGEPRGAVSPGSPASQRTAAPPGAWPDQPPVSSRGRLSTSPRTPVRYPPGSGGPGRYGGPRWRRWLRPRRIFGVIACVVVLALVATLATYFYLNSKLDRSAILVDYPGRPAPGSGTNWLIAGSDSRQGLTAAQMKEYSTGQLQTSSNGLSDTIMILHIPAGGGRPILISVPRDSYVNIPGYGMNKINAAFSDGGPALLAKTIQSDTGLYINHFMDIGFGGFVNVVNAVGGVRLCLPTAIQDQASGLNLPAGCQVLDGGEALAWVRDRHSFATEDLQREQDQRIFLAALLRKMTSAGVILNPFKALPAATGVVSNLTVDQATKLYQLLSAGRALRNPLTTTVPIANANYETAAGDSVLWNSAAATELFTDLQNGQPVPANLITGSTLG